MADLASKVAVVLGCSAPGGTGAAIARALAGAGAKVVVAARTQAPLEKLAEEIGGSWALCDAADSEQVAALARFAADTYGAIDVAINAAGMPVVGPIETSTTAAIQSGLDVNYIAHVHFIREIAHRMNDGGSLILISSSSAAQPVGNYFAYACAKAATDCLVRYAAIEYGRRGIRVNSILPGPIRTDMAKHLYERPGVADIFAREVPLGRIGEPGDYADVALWLSGPAFVTGSNIPVSGGNHLTRTPRADEIPA